MLLARRGLLRSTLGLLTMPAIVMAMSLKGLETTDWLCSPILTKPDDVDRYFAILES